MLIAHSYPTLCHPVDSSPPGSSVHRILQARILEWVAIPFSRGPSWPRDGTQVSCIAGGFFTGWATREAYFHYVQFSLVAQLFPTFATPWTDRSFPAGFPSLPGFPAASLPCLASLSIINSWSLLKLISIKSMMPSNHLILCSPLILLPSIFMLPLIKIFSIFLHSLRPFFQGPFFGGSSPVV